MYVEKLENKNGKLYGYRLHCSAKDFITGKNVVHKRTWRFPEYFSKAEIKAELKTQIYEFEMEIKENASNCLNYEKRTTFIDYARKWLAIKKDEMKKSYYHRCSEIINQLEKRFGKLLLVEMNQSHIQKLVQDMKMQNIQKKASILTCDISGLIKDNFSTYTKFCKKAKVSDTTLLVARRKEKISYDSAQKICKALKISYNKYFTTINNEEKHYAKATIKRVTNVISAIFNYALLHNIVKDNYAKSQFLDLKMKKADMKLAKDKVYSLDIFKQFMNVLQSEDGLSITLKTLFTTEIFLGLRRGEALALSWDKIDFERNQILINKQYLYTRGKPYFENTTKGGAPRCLTASATLMNLLKEYKQYWDEKLSIRCDSNYLFIKESDGELYHPQATGRALSRFYVKHPEFKRLTQHCFRHQNITMSLSSNLPINMVSGRAGHAEISTTVNIYGHYIPSEDALAANTLDNLLKDDITFAYIKQG